MDSKGNIYRISSEDLTAEGLAKEIAKHGLQTLPDNEAKHLQGMNRAQRRDHARKMGWFKKDYKERDLNQSSLPG